MVVVILLIFIMCFSQFFLPSNTNFVCAVDEENSVFARIMFDSVCLYRSPVEDDSASNQFFELPKTYFVQLIDSCNDKFYKATYASIEGYVKKECVQAISGTPTNPYLDNLHFRVYAEMSRDLRSAPTTDNNLSSQVIYLPNLTRNLTFLGRINGERLIEGRTNIWYYCKYSAETEFYGYVYSDFCDELTLPLPTNSEEVSYVTNPTFEKPKEEIQSVPLNNKSVPIIIGILCVPALILILMISKGKTILSKQNRPSGEIKDY